MDRPWLESYPEGVPHEISTEAYTSVTDVFDQSARRFAELPAFSNFGTTLTYGQLHELTAQMAAYLKDDLGLKRGDRVAVMMPNILQNPVAIFSILRAGLTVVNVNPLYTARELKHQLNDSGAKAILILENFAHVLAKVIADTPIEHVVLTRMGDLLAFPKSVLINLVVKYVKKMVPPFRLPRAVAFKDALGRGKRHRFETVPSSHEDIAFLQYTGGTTGVAKGAVLTHGNMVANMVQAAAWITERVDPGKETIVTALPLYHIFSLTANCLVFMKFGARNLLITNPRDMAGFVKELKNERFSAITGVNTLFNGLLHTPGFAEVDFSRLRMTLGGGMAVQRAVAERWKEVTGSTLVEAYGLTETAPAACINPLDLEAFNGKIGLPIPSTEVSMQNDDWQELPVGEIGEICIRGPQVMREYWNKPDETAKVLSPEGWFHTGDIGFMDEAGYVQIVDRKKDMILVSGFNVFPNEVEDVIAQLPGVKEVGVIGVPDERSTEAVAAIIVRGDPALTAEAIRAHCNAELTNYKRPKHVFFADELPKTNVGKILRRELREKYANHAA